MRYTITDASGVRCSGPLTSVTDGRGGRMRGREWAQTQPVVIGICPNFSNGRLIWRLCTTNNRVAVHVRHDNCTLAPDTLHSMSSSPNHAADERRHAQAPHAQPPHITNPQTRSSSVVYDILLWILARTLPPLPRPTPAPCTCADVSAVMLDVFFREIRSRGSYRIPRRGPVIFVAAPHANQATAPP
jgi:hypothetical protein